jgi:hypothetical protein
LLPGGPRAFLGRLWSAWWSSRWHATLVKRKEILEPWKQAEEKTYRTIGFDFGLNLENGSPSSIPFHESGG